MSYFNYTDTIDDEVKTGTSWEPDIYKFRVERADEKISKSGEVKYISLELKTWLEDNSEGPKIFSAFFPFGDKDFPKKQFASFVKVTTGKADIAALSDLVGKAGKVVLQNGPKGYLEPATLGFFDKNGLSASGNKDSIIERLALAVQTVKTERSSAPTQAKAATVTAATVTAAEDQDLPF